MANLDLKRNVRKAKTMKDSRNGLYKKFYVSRVTDPAHKHRHCDYFVLDLVHDQHAISALLAYAESCFHEFPELAGDLRKRVVAMFLPEICSCPYPHARQACHNDSASNEEEDILRSDEGGEA